MPRYPVKKDRAQLVNDIDYNGLVKTLGPEDIEAISKVAWGQATGVRELNRLLMHKQYNKMHFRQKQKAIVEFLAGVITDIHFQQRFTVWSMENPGDAMKMFLTTVPKEAEVTVTHEGGVVLLVPKMNSIEDWQEEMEKQAKTIDVTPMENEGA